MAHAAGSTHGIPRGRLDWVEVGRGLAALAVVCSHMPPIAHIAWNQAYGLGAMGVEFFFLLSGFIMLHIHYADIGRPRALAHFAWRRVGRIFPTYWIVLVLVLVTDSVLVSAQYRPQIDIAFLARQVFLLPGEQLFIGPAWTLRHELFFYSVFAMLILDRRLGAVAFVVWMAAVIVALPRIGPGMAPTHLAGEVMLHHYNLDFALGMAMAVALRRSWLNAALISGGIVAITLLAAWIATGMPAASWLQIFTYKAIFFAALAAAVRASLQPRRAPAMLLLLGAASYSIYLVNRAIGYDLMRIARRVPIERMIGTWPMFVLFVGVAVCAGLILYVLFERPILRWVATRSPPRRA